MNYWRIGIAVLLSFLAGPPLLFPVRDLIIHSVAWRAWGDFDRVLELTRSSLLLSAGTILLAIPLGTAVALVLFRFELPGRSFLHAIMLVSLFLPLPLLVSGWEAAYLLLGESRQPGLVFSIGLHAIYALPWVVFIVGVGLRNVERSSEEDALTKLPLRRVLLSVTLKRSRTAIFAAAVWVLVQTSSEIVVTNLYQVRTFAEEVYTQFVSLDPSSGGADPDVLAARALVLSLPNAVGLGLLLLLIGRRFHLANPSAPRWSPPLLFSTGRATGPVTFLIWLLVVGLLAAPLIGLLGQASFTRMSRTLVRSSLYSSLLTAMGVGTLTTLLALILCWLARESRTLLVLTAVVAFLALALPGPVLGLGMKTTIFKLVSWPDWAWLNALLYDGPSYFPVMWIQMIRLLPFALALLWPTMRMIPSSLFEMARLDGATPRKELFRLVIPLMRLPVFRAALLLTALSLGEISASKLVSTPGAATFAEQLFMQLHYASEADLAARSLLLLAVVAPLAVLFSFLAREPQR